MVRLACRFVNSITFLMQHAEGTHPHLRSNSLRDTDVSDECLKILKQGREDMQKMLTGHCHDMFENWINQALAEVTSHMYDHAFI